jgi:hypothetical protein
VTGVAASGVETGSVVTNLDEDTARASLDANPRFARAGMLDDIGECLASDAEEFPLSTGRECEALGPLDLDVQPVPRAEH